MVDSIAPTITRLDSSPQPASTLDQITFTLAAEDDASGVDYMELRVAGLQERCQGEGECSLTMGPLPEGRHNVEVSAADEEGNLSEVRSRELAIYAPCPDLRLESFGVERLPDNIVEVSWSAVGGCDRLEVAIFGEYGVSGEVSLFEEGLARTSSHSFQLEVVCEGTFNAIYQVEALDAGNPVSEPQFASASRELEHIFIC